MYAVSKTKQIQFGEEHVIPGSFAYHRPASVDEAVALLGQFGEDGKVLAGGHSLIPMMKLRLATPEHLIDINGIGELKGIREEGGQLRIGAAATQADILASDLLAKACPLLPEAAALIADPQIRYCGTLGGNVANGDPGNDMPAVMMALAAIYALRGPGGAREVAARDFYHGTFDTALAENELLTEIRIPTPAPGHGASYQKMKRKVGDYATAAAAAVLSFDGDRCASAAVTLTNVGEAAIFVTEAGDALVGTAVDDTAVAEAAARAMALAAPVSDLRGPAEYRTQMAGEMARRAIRTAAARAKGG